MKKGILAGISFMAGLTGGAVTAGMAAKKTATLANKETILYQRCYNITSQWILHKQNGISLDKYFTGKGYHSIAIYGMGRLGILLYEELKNSDIEVVYGIDMDPYCTYPGLKIVQPEDEPERADVIVVTPVMAFDDIREMLAEKTEIPVLSIEEVVYEI